MTLSIDPQPKPMFKIAIALLGLVIILIVVNFNINRYEAHLTTGDTVLLELAPVDPRGLMQGDYMRLQFDIAEDIMHAVITEKESLNVNTADRQPYDYTGEGIAIIKKDEHGVGRFERLIDANTLDQQTLEINELPLYYRAKEGQITFATDAFFFQEGHASAYEAAEYGLFRVNNKGKPLLTNMVDKDFKIIEGVLADK